MKIRFAKAPSGATIINAKAFSNPPMPITGPSHSNIGNSATGYPCQYCGKLFSNQSNRRRHAVLSCELARNAGVEPRKSRDEKTPKPTIKTPFNEDFYYEMEGVPNASNSFEQTCPFPECDVTHTRSALMKKHLNEAHNIQNDGLSVDLEKKVKSEPTDMLEIEQHDVCEADERKVPPLRVKISQVMSQKEGATSPIKTEPKEPKPYVSCPICHEFKSNNLYILGRHQKSCEKKMEAKQQLERSLEQEENPDNEEDGDTTIEVPVDFEQENNEEEEDQLEEHEQHKICENDNDDQVTVADSKSLNDQSDDSENKNNPEVKRETSEEVVQKESSEPEQNELKKEANKEDRNKSPSPHNKSPEPAKDDDKEKTNDESPNTDASNANTESK